MGIEPYLLASTLNLIIAQRLVKKICDRCKEPITLSEKLFKRLNIDPKVAKESVFYHGKGCKTCGGTGYFGRLPIFEFLVVDNEIRKKIIAGVSELQISEILTQKGYDNLLGNGVKKILQGLTTAEEVLSITFTENIR